MPAKRRGVLLTQLTFGCVYVYVNLLPPPPPPLETPVFV